MPTGKDNIAFAITTTPRAVADVDAPPRLVDRDVSNSGGDRASLWLCIRDVSTEGTAHSGKGIGDVPSAPSEDPT